MIVDTFTHVWESVQQLGRRTPSGRRKDQPADPLLHADPMEHFESLGPVDVAFVLAFRSRLLEARVPNRLAADYVRSHPDRLIGVASIDPTLPDWPEQFLEAVEDLGMRAVVISPSAQGFHPMDTRVQPLYRELARRGLPLFVYSGPCPAAEARLEFAQPVLLDEVLREHDGLRLILPGMGSPWIEQTLALMTKHANVLANLGPLLQQPWQAYNALMLANDCRLIDRLVFSSNFPFATAVACVEMLYSINRNLQGTGMTPIPRELLRGIVERDTLAMLGIEWHRPAAPEATASRPDSPQASPGGDPADSNAQ